MLGLETKLNVNIQSLFLFGAIYHYRNEKLFWKKERSTCCISYDRCFLKYLNEKKVASYQKDLRFQLSDRPKLYDGRSQLFILS